MHNEDASSDDVSLQLFEIRCSVTDPDQCVLYITHGNIGMPDDGDPWLWMQECFHCQHRQFNVSPWLHARRKFGPGRQSGKDCRKLDEFNDGSEQPEDEYTRLVAKIKKDIAEAEATGLA